MRTGTTENGKKIEPVKLNIEQMRCVAQAFGLSRREFLGKDAYRYFTDEYSFEEFERALHRVNYGREVDSKDQSLSHTEAFLQKLEAQHGLERDGISVHFIPKAQQRGLIGRRREAENTESKPFEVGGRAVVEVKSKRLVTVALLAIFDLPGAEIPNVVVFSPSFAISEKEILPNRTARIPDATDHLAKGGFKIHAQGHIHFVCVLTTSGDVGLAARAATSPEDYYTFRNERDLAELEQRLFEMKEEAVRAGKCPPVLLHRAIRVT